MAFISTATPTELPAVLQPSACLMVPQQNRQKCRLNKNPNVHEDCGIFVHVLDGLYELFETLYFSEWHFNVIHLSGKKNSLYFFGAPTYLHEAFKSVSFLFSPCKMGSCFSFPD